MLDNAFENIYDTYCKTLFGIAIEISATTQEAEKILTLTFIKANKQNLTQQIYPSICLTLIKLLIQTAHEQLTPAALIPNFKLKQFENTPLLHKLLCQQVSFESHCIENNLSRVAEGKILREEFSLLSNTNPKEAIPPESFQ